MSKEDDVFKSLIAGGHIGAGLGALLTNKKKDDTILGAIAGAAIMATLKASEEAKVINFPVHIVEEGNLYERMPDGTKKFVRTIRSSNKKYQSNYKLM
jgi:hypothetical protein